MNKLILVVMSACLALAVGCSSSTQGGTCTFTGECWDFIAGYDGKEASVCAEVGGRLSSEATCSAAGRTGRCTITSTSGQTHRSNHYSPFYTTMNVQRVCPPIPPTAGVTYEFQEN